MIRFNYGRNRWADLDMMDGRRCLLRQGDSKLGSIVIIAGIAQVIHQLCQWWSCSREQISYTLPDHIEGVNDEIDLLLLTGDGYFRDSKSQKVFEGKLRIEGDVGFPSWYEVTSFKGVPEEYEWSAGAPMSFESDLERAFQAEQLHASVRHGHGLVRSRIAVPHHSVVTHTVEMAQGVEGWVPTCFIKSATEWDTASVLVYPEEFDRVMEIFRNHRDTAVSEAWKTLLPRGTYDAAWVDGRDYLSSIACYFEEPGGYEIIARDRNNRVLVMRVPQHDGIVCGPGAAAHVIGTQGRRIKELRKKYNRDFRVV